MELKQNPEELIKQRRKAERDAKAAEDARKREIKKQVNEKLGKKELTKKRKVKKLGITVVEAAKQRILEVLSDPEIGYVYVSSSGGKDSNVMLQLTLDVIKENLDNPNVKKKVGVFHQDFEAIYSDTYNVLKRIWEKNKDYIDLYWCCLPLQTQCAVSLEQDYWIPWDKAAKHLWVREMPEWSINEDNHPFGKYFYPSMPEKDFQKSFHSWMCTQHEGKVVSLVGVRADESLMRRILVMQGPVWHDIPGPAQPSNKQKLVLYPIYDWKTSDVWRATAEFDWEMNMAYQLMHLAGMNPSDMRIASPFNDAAPSTLKFYKSLEPETWGKMLGRVTGVKFAGSYGGTRAMSAAKLAKPEGKTWKEFAELLLNTIPSKELKMEVCYKIYRSARFWRTIGGAISARYMEELRIAHADEFESGNFVAPEGEKRKGHQLLYIKNPIEEPLTKNQHTLPTWKVICICLLKCDYMLKYAGFGMTYMEKIARSRAVMDYSGLSAKSGGK